MPQASFESSTWRVPPLSEGPVTDGSSLHAGCAHGDASRHLGDAVALCRFLQPSPDRDPEYDRGPTSDVAGRRFGPCNG
jgi:hypothetical protein